MPAARELPATCTRGPLSNKPVTSLHRPLLDLAQHPQQLERPQRLSEQDTAQAGIVAVAVANRPEEQADLVPRDSGSGSSSRRRIVAIPAQTWAVAGSARMASLFGKYWYRDPMECPAVSAMRLVVPAAYPYSEKTRAAAFSSRCRVSTARCRRGIFLGCRRLVDTASTSVKASSRQSELEQNAVQTRRAVFCEQGPDPGALRSRNGTPRPGTRRKQPLSKPTPRQKTPRHTKQRSPQPVMATKASSWVESVEEAGRRLSTSRCGTGGGTPGRIRARKSSKAASLPASRDKPRVVRR